MFMRITIRYILCVQQGRLHVKVASKGVVDVSN